jgi:hypothetical protein
MVVDDEHFGFIEEARKNYEEAIPNALALG